MKSLVDLIINKITKKNIIKHIKSDNDYLRNKTENLSNIIEEQSNLHSEIITNKNNIIIGLKNKNNELIKEKEKEELKMKGEFAGKLADKDRQLLLFKKQDSLQKDTESFKFKRRLTHYDNLIRKMFNEQQFKPKHHILNDKKLSIILDTNIILNPYNSGGDHLPLLNLIKTIKIQNLQPIIFPTLWSEISQNIKDIIPKPFMTIFPAYELIQYFNNCFNINEKLEQITEIKQKLQSDLNTKEAEELSKSGKQNMNNDLLYLAIAKYYDAVLITEDKPLLNLSKNPDRNLKILTLYPPKKDTNFTDLSYKKHLPKIINNKKHIKY